MGIIDRVSGLLRRLYRFLRKLVTPSLVITANLTATSGQTGTNYNLVVVSTQNGQPDVGDAVDVTATAPDGSATTLTGTTDATGKATFPITAGTQTGAYSYAVTVGGETGPTATFTRRYSPISYPLAHANSRSQPEAVLRH